MIRQFCLVPDTILPFIIMIGLDTCFNEITLVTLSRVNVRLGTGLLGGSRIYLIGHKERAGKHQRRSFAIDESDPFSVGALLATLTTFTANIRELVDPRHSDAVFIAARMSGEPAAFFDHWNDISGTLGRELDIFRKENNLPHFSINDLRTIGGSVAAMMSDGDILVQKAILNHLSVRTTLDHYQTQRDALLRQEQLGHIMNERERFVTSNGRIDARGQGPKLGLYRAATPGFDCLDPFDSPIHGERRGTLCSAYGKCPRCPKAVLIKNSINAARLVQLDQRFLEARENLNRARWIMEWEKEHEMLTNFWILLLPPELLREAYRAEMPPIPAID